MVKRRPAGRMLERQQVHLAGRCAPTDRSLAAGLQPCPASQFAAVPDPARICSARSATPDRRRRRSPALNCLKTGPSANAAETPLLNCLLDGGAYVTASAWDSDPPRGTASPGAALEFRLGMTATSRHGRRIRWTLVPSIYAGTTIMR